MARYIGVQPTEQQVSYRSVSEFSAEANQTAFLINYTPGAMDVYVNGMMELRSSYLADSGTDVIFSSPLYENDKVVFVTYSSVRQIFNSQTNKITTADPGTSDASNLGYDIGSTWTNTTTGDTFICIDNTPGAAVWVNSTKTNNLFI